MNGDAHAPGTGSSQPLPPAFPEQLSRGLESAEQAMHPPFFPGMPPAARPTPAHQVAETPVPMEDEALPTPEDFGYLEPAEEEPVTGEIPAEAFLEAPVTDYPESAYPESAFETPLSAAAEPVYEEPTAAAPPLPMYDEPLYNEPTTAAPPLPTYDEPAYDEPTGAEAEVADRLEMLARDLRARGTQAIHGAFAGDALDAALAGLISGYLAGRDH